MGDKTTFLFFDIRMIQNRRRVNNRIVFSDGVWQNPACRKSFTSTNKYAILFSERKNSRRYYDFELQQTCIFTKERSMWFGTESGLAENFAFYIDKMEDQKWLPGENR